jgi:CheY-like chemotaxis protein
VVAISVRVEQLDSTRLQTSLTTEHPEPGEFVILEVVDTGVGMDQDTIQRIFDPFFSSKVHGRGLGMSAVLGIVKSHGGAIFLKSQPGIGTTIQVAFPAQPEEDSPAEEENAASENAEAACRVQKSSKKKILVADDEDAVRDVTSVMIERLGYEALEARNGREAVEIFRENRDDIACIILDLSMPVMDGITAIGRLREIDELVPVIITSGYSRNEKVEEVLNNPTVRFLQKPYSFADIQRMVEDLLKS